MNELHDREAYLKKKLSVEKNEWENEQKKLNSTIQQLKEELNKKEEEKKQLADEKKDLQNRIQTLEFEKVR